MDRFKIDIFKKENPNSQFPDYKSLTLEECVLLKKALTKKLGIPDTIGGETLIFKIIEESKFVDFLSELNDGYNFEEIFNNLKIKKSTYIYINWWHFDRIDRMSTDDFINNFDYVWYPSSDDIEVIDENLNWILVIDHEGAIRFLQL